MPKKKLSREEVAISWLRWAQRYIVYVSPDAKSFKLFAREMLADLDAAKPRRSYLPNEIETARVGPEKSPISWTSPVSKPRRKEKRP